MHTFVCQISPPHRLNQIKSNTKYNPIGTNFIWIYISCFTASDRISNSKKEPFQHSRSLIRVKYIVLLNSRKQNDTIMFSFGGFLSIPIDGNF